jgi:hypothetical protein
LGGLTAEGPKVGAQIPDDPALEGDFTAPQYGYSNKSQIPLAKSEHESPWPSFARLGRSSRDTFAVTVSAHAASRKKGSKSSHAIAIAGDGEWGAG